MASEASFPRGGSPCGSATGGTKTILSTNYVENPLGQDTAAGWVEWEGWTGSAATACAANFVFTGASNHSGVSVQIALRETDVPDGSIKSGTPASYQRIDLSPLDYLSKNVTVRLVYASPKVGDNWRKLVKRDRVRFWAVEHDVMKGWRGQMKADADLAAQDRFWKWVRDNVDYRVRRGV